MYGNRLNTDVALTVLSMPHPSVCASPIFVGKRFDSEAPDGPEWFCSTRGLSEDKSDEHIKFRIRHHQKEEKLIVPPGSQAT